MMFSFWCGCLLYPAFLLEASEDEFCSVYLDTYCTWPDAIWGGLLCDAFDITGRDISKTVLLTGASNHAILSTAFYQAILHFI